jgi:hypothetical protein
VVDAEAVEVGLDAVPGELPVVWVHRAPGVDPAHLREAGELAGRVERRAGLVEVRLTAVPVAEQDGRLGDVALGVRQELVAPELHLRLLEREVGASHENAAHTDLEKPLAVGPRGKGLPHVLEGQPGGQGDGARVLRRVALGRQAMLDADRPKGVQDDLLVRSRVCLAQHDEVGLVRRKRGGQRLGARRAAVPQVERDDAQHAVSGHVESHPCARGEETACPRRPRDA